MVYSGLGRTLIAEGAIAPGLLDLRPSASGRSQASRVRGRPLPLQLHQYGSRPEDDDGVPFIASSRFAHRRERRRGHTHTHTSTPRGSHNSLLITTDDDVFFRCCSAAVGRSVVVRPSVVVDSLLG